MDREFKFRAWDNEEKHFWYFTLQEILERQMSYQGSWDVKILKGGKEQYTGLEDKSGKEIYEGDILEFELNIGNEKVETIKAPVIYYTCEFAIFKDDYEDSFYLSLSDLVGELGQNLKIIGNIYQNPELLQN